MKKIKLSHNKYALVDDVDIKLLDDYIWYAYWRNGRLIVNGRHKDNDDVVFMHRLILGLTKHDGQVVFHKDRNKLNNQRINLRQESRKHPKRKSADIERIDYVYEIAAKRKAKRKDDKYSNLKNIIAVIFFTIFGILGIDID